MTSTIFIGIGQCGNQVLDTFINQELCCNRKFYPHLLSKKKLSCIFVDTEPKVLNKIKTQSKYRDILRTENIISGLNGRGSNWSFGYNGCRTAPDISQCVLSTLRREIERCDNYLGVILCHSLGGGTGAGFGCKLTELIRDEFQLHQIVNCVVAPSDCGGDSPLQYYNCSLSLASLNRSSDGLILFHNDSLLSQLGFSLPSPIKMASSNYKSSSSSNSTKTEVNPCLTNNKLSLSTVNNLIALQLGSLFSPCSSLYPWESVTSNVSIELNELLRSLCSFPDSKIVRCVTSKSCPSNTDWISVIKSTMRQLKCGYGNIYDTIASICCYRGDVRGNCHLSSVDVMQSQLYSQMHFVDWNKSDAIDVWIGNHPNETNRVSLAFNSGCITNYLSHIKQQGTLKYTSSAYLHWYYRYGATQDTFTDSFEELDKMMASYRDVTLAV